MKRLTLIALAIFLVVTVAMAQDNVRRVEGGWLFFTETSALDDATTAYLEIEADTRVGDGLLAYTPVLVLRCTGDVVEAYIYTEDVISRDYETDTTQVRYRFDHGPTLMERMSVSTNHQAIFVNSPTTFIGELAAHNRLVVGYTPFEGSEVEAIFHLSGLAYNLPEWEHTCRLPVPIAITMPSGSTPMPAPAECEMEIVTVTIARAPVYESPDSNSDVLFWLSRGDAMCVLAETDDYRWLHITTADGDGWIRPSVTSIY